MDLGIFKTFTRIKVNVYPNTEIVREHADHTDRPYFIKAALFGLNTCDGYTTVGKKKLPSVANRIYFFDASKPVAPAVPISIVAADVVTPVV